MINCKLFENFKLNSYFPMCQISSIACFLAHLFHTQYTICAFRYTNTPLRRLFGLHLPKGYAAQPKTPIAIYTVTLGRYYASNS